jgi:hypothetical protein
MAVILALMGFATSQATPTAPAFDKNVKAFITEVKQNGVYIVNGSDDIANGSTGIVVPSPTPDEISNGSVVLVPDGTFTVKGHVSNYDTKNWSSIAVYFASYNDTYTNESVAVPDVYNPYDKGAWMNMTQADDVNGWTSNREFTAIVQANDHALMQVTQGENGTFFYGDDFATVHNTRPTDVIQVWAVDQNNNPVTIGYDMPAPTANPLVNLGLILVANAEKIWDGNAYARVHTEGATYTPLPEPTVITPGDNTVTPTVKPHVVITIPQGNMSDGTAIYDSQTGTWTFSKPDLYKWLDLGLLLKIVGLA